MVTPVLGPTGEPTPPDPQAGPVRDGDGPQPAQDIVLEEAEVPDAEADTSLADPSIGQKL